MKIKGKELEVVRSRRFEIAGIKCDICGTIIEPPSKEDRFNWMDEKYKYYEVTTGHHDWGNESCESVQHYDICPGCIDAFTNEYLKNKDSQRSGYIDIETDHICYGQNMFEYEKN